MDVIPIAALSSNCPSCGGAVRLLTVSSGTYLLDDAVHGLTERFDAQGRVTSYDQLPVWPAHICTP